MAQQPPVPGIQVDEINDARSRAAYDRARVANKAGQPQAAQTALRSIPAPSPTAGGAAPPPGVPPAAPPAAGPGGVPARGGVGSALRGAAGPVIGGAIEGYNVKQAYDRGGAGAAKDEAIAGGTRLASAAGGAWAGGKVGLLGGPAAKVTVPLGAVAGGVAGYFGGDEAVRGLQGSGGISPIPEKTEGMPSDEALSAMGWKPASPVARDGVAVAGGRPEVMINPTPNDLARQGALRDASGLPAAKPWQSEWNGYEDAAGRAPRAAATPAAGSPDESLGTFNGREITRKEAEERAGMLQTMPAGISPLANDPRGRVPVGGAAQAQPTGAPRMVSNAGEINRRFDDILEAGRGKNKRMGLDWATRHSLTVAQQREQALAQDAGRQLGARGQDMDRMRTDADRMSREDIAAADLMQRANDSALRRASGSSGPDGETRDDARANRAAKSMVDFSQRMFGDNEAAAKQFEKAFRATNPEFFTMPEGDRESLLATFKEEWDAQQAVRERAAARGLAIPTGLADVGTERVPINWGDEATVGDWWESFRLFGPNAPTALETRGADGQPKMKVSADAVEKRADGSRRERADLILRNQGR